ncbi:P-loop containing nucleoside triphosphate hydrolase protein [Crucibulum laeve]|uniref:P-loop containing nucleoside triphosphate hydrolase protein n=1 Tax=Crucibulum laeve TaxID=68775 RepID=A0A5C3LWR6_9AGAR|nr:P-loop containing nucleoside triphosphate hydrolase protein [Crucibulum laeve]
MRHRPKAENLRDKYPRRVQPPLIGVQQGEPYYESIKTYQDHFMKLLESEEEEDEAILKERLSSWTVTRLREEGYCITDMGAYWLQVNQFGRPVASFNLGPGVTLPEHRFENGSQILLSRFNPLSEKPIQGSVVSSTTSQIRICFQEQFDDLDDGAWRIDLGRPNIIFERMRTAIRNLNHDPQQLEETPVSSDREFILQGTHLRDVLLRTYDPNSTHHEHRMLQDPDDPEYPSYDVLEHANRANGEFGHMGAFKDDMRIQSWAARYSLPKPLMVDGDPVLENMNESQTKAMATMIGQRISLVQGPPGTGKTKTIIETIKLLKLHFQVPHPILVCTYTNAAVDNLAEGFINAGVKPLRIGFAGNVRASLVEHSLDYKLGKHSLQPTLEGIVKDEADLSIKMHDLQRRIVDAEKKGGSKLEQRKQNMKRALITMERQHSVIRRKMYAIKQQMLRDVVEDADVICTTCVTSACVALNVMDFPVVFLDEASMSTEPASLIPIMKGSRHVALIGDHKQLPPVITSPEAQSLGLGISLFERLTEEGVVPSVMLDVQYRMHPEISRFPSSEFYNYTLRDGTIDAQGNIPSRLLPPSSQHLLVDAESGKRPSVIFLDHTGSESNKDRSKININEAYIVASVVEDLLLHNPHLRGEDIGIIAPYVAQISLLTRLFNTDAKHRVRTREVLGDLRAMQLANIEIKTVDGFEGREKEVIIFSTVRNNDGGYIGFLADRRRLNVGLTRAKRGLFVVGNIGTLKAGKMGRGKGENAVVRVGKGAESWRRYAKFLAEQGLVVSLNGPALDRALYANLNAVRALPAGSRMKG